MINLLVHFILFFLLLVSFFYSINYKWWVLIDFWFLAGILDIPALVSCCIAYRKKEVEGGIWKWVWEILATIALSCCLGYFIHLKTLIATGATGNLSFIVAICQKDSTPLIFPSLSLLVLIVFSYHFTILLHLSISAASNIQPYLMLFYFVTLFSWLMYMFLGFYIFFFACKDMAICVRVLENLQV